VVSVFVQLYLYCAVSLFESHMHYFSTHFVALKVVGGQMSAM